MRRLASRSARPWWPGSARRSFTPSAPTLRRQRTFSSGRPVPPALRAPCLAAIRSRVHSSATTTETRTRIRPSRTVLASVLDIRPEARARTQTSTPSMPASPPSSTLARARRPQASSAISMKLNMKIRKPTGRPMVFPKNFHMPEAWTAVAISAATLISALMTFSRPARRAERASRNSRKSTPGPGGDGRRPGPGRAPRSSPGRRATSRSPGRRRVRAYYAPSRTASSRMTSTTVSPRLGDVGL